MKTRKQCRCPEEWTRRSYVEHRGKGQQKEKNTQEDAGQCRKITDKCKLTLSAGQSDLQTHN